ncbi:MAG TPA: o-succinylbenzoate synthase [Mycobacteriales bacterium]|nr:o-succinylbenzoate synthase [Mycobacteriales bacterium]
MTEDRAPIVFAEVREVALPLLRPFVTGFGVTDSRRTVLVRVRDAAGNEGWGEGPALDHPYYLPDTVASTFAVATEFAMPLALAAGTVAPSAVVAALNRIRGNTFARAAVEAAYWSLRAAVEGVSLRSLVGGVADAVAVGESLGIAADIGETLDEVRLRLDEGYQRIKLKVQPGWDVDVVAAVRDLVGDRVMLQVDANSAYTLDDADTLGKLDDFGLACIEQPLEWDSLIEHAELQRRLRTPICLDESLRSPADVRRALDLDACRNVNLKPARVGGITASLEIAALCQARGVPLWCGGMMESGIGRAGNLALCSLPAFTEPADMSPAAVLFEWDLVDPTYQVAGDGTIAVPSEPGLGFPVRADRVEQQTIRREVVLDG